MSQVEVISVVGTVEDDWDSEMEWSDEVSDEEVSALVDLLSEGHAFVSSEFIGGVRPGDVPILAEKEPAGKGKQKKAGGGRKRARKSASGISPPESLGFTEAQMKWIEDYIQTAVQSATSAPTDPGISKEKTPGKEQMGGPSETPGKATESSSRKRKGPPKKRNPTAKRYRSKQVTDPDTPKPHTAAGDDDVPRESDDDGDEQPNPDTRSHDPMEDVDTAGGEQNKEGSVEEEPKTDDSASRHSTVEPPSESNAQASTVTPDQTDEGQTKEGSAEGAQEADGSVPRHSPLKRATDGDAMADSTAAGQGGTNVVGVSVTADKVGEDKEVEGDGSSERTPSPPATNPDAPTKEATPDEPGNTSDQSCVNEAADEGKTSEQNPSHPVTVTHAATKESTPSPPKPSASSQHLSPVSPGQVINSVVSQLSAQDKDTGAEVDVQGGDSSQKAMDFLNKTGDLDLGGGFTISTVDLRDALEFASPSPPWVMDAFLQLFRLKHAMLRDRYFFFQGTRFASLLGRDYTKFLKAGKAKFTFGEEILACIPRQVSRIYFPFNFDKQTWVGVCVDVPGHCLHVLDSRVAARRDVRIRNELKALAEMIPYLMKAVGAGGETRTLSVKPYTISRDHRLPQCEDLFASGVMSVMFIEAHALGGFDACFTINPEAWVSNGRSYVMQLADYAV